MKHASTTLLLLAALAATRACAHGVITEVQGANKVKLPGLSLIDGTPRDCASPVCGAEADTSIIRAAELGTSRASALGRTPAGGPVSAAKMMALFMHQADGNATDDTTAGPPAARKPHKPHLAHRALLGAGQTAGGGGAGTRTPKGTTEAGVQAATGAAAAAGLPTTHDDGTITMTYHQVNQDGAGPLVAAIDATSGGTDPAAFQDAAVTQNVPGFVAGLSLASATDFPVTVQMPAGMTCQGQVGVATGVCIARLHNAALGGPFGGSVAFTQSPAAKKRAIEYRLAQKRFATNL